MTTKEKLAILWECMVGAAKKEFANSKNENRSQDRTLSSNELDESNFSKPIFGCDYDDIYNVAHETYHPGHPCNWKNPNRDK